MMEGVGTWAIQRGRLINLILLSGLLKSMWTFSVTLEINYLKAILYIGQRPSTKEHVGRAISALQNFPETPKANFRFEVRKRK